MLWREAFARQAKSDYEMYLFLNEKRKPLCHQLHFLQMASEKLAKAWLCPKNGVDRPPSTHNMLIRFLEQAKSIRKIRSACNMRQKGTQYKAYIDGLRPLAQKIESLAPAGSIDKPNPEYPWCSATSVICPVDYSFHDINNTMRISKFCRFLKTCIDMI
ncbi:MAG: hypothetical protein JXA11_08990 [Phycisphaerae bacterium]|nr:hypothetical protein [Phycisphaerae bacterium]